MRSFIHQGGMLGGECFREWLAWFLPEKQAISVFLWKAVYVNTLRKSGGDCASSLPSALIWWIKFRSHTSIGPSRHASPGSPEGMVSIMESVRRARAALYWSWKGQNHVLWGEQGASSTLLLWITNMQGDSHHCHHSSSTDHLLGFELSLLGGLSFEFLFFFSPHWLIMDICPFGRYNGVCSLEYILKLNWLCELLVTYLAHFCLAFLIYKMRMMMISVLRVL